MAIKGLGIALGGGAARGWAHIGVLKTLMAAGLAPEIVVGTSIGAVVGGCYIAEKLPQLEDFARSLTRRGVFGFLDFSFAGSGLITGQRLCNELDHHLTGLQIQQMNYPFIAVATELGTGHEIWINQGHLVDAMRASYALPGIFQPVKLSGKWLVDGALVNPIPVSVCRALGAHHVIAINLNGDIGTKGAVIPGHTAVDDLRNREDDGKRLATNGRAARMLLHRQFFGAGEKGPGISSVMMDAISITQDRIARARLAGDPPDTVVCPKLGGVGVFDFHLANEAILEGERATRRAIVEIEHAVSQIAVSA